MSSIPNLPLSDVPIGQDENANVEIEEKGEIKEFDFKPKSHYELGENLKMLDFDLATKTTGSRFVFVKNKLALLERALSNFMLFSCLMRFSKCGLHRAPIFVAPVGSGWFFQSFSLELYA